MIRVLHIVESFEAGTYEVVRNLAAHCPPERVASTILHGTRRPGYDRTAVARDFPPTALVAWRHAVRSIHPYHDGLALCEALRLIRRVRPHVIHCHSSKAGALGRLAAALAGAPGRTLYTLHGAGCLQEDQPPWSRYICTRAERYLARLGGIIVATSLSERRKLDAAGIRAVVIPNGVDVSRRYEPVPISTGPPWRVVTAARITEVKNPRLFNAVAQRFLHDTRFDFVWVGDGEHRRLLSSPNVTVTGWLPHSLVRDILDRSHVYLSTSLSEGLPMAVLEAMAAGRPLLLSDCTGNRDLVRDGNGFLFRGLDEASARLRHLAENPARLPEMGERSLRVVRNHYSIEASVRGYMALYEQCARVRRPEPSSACGRADPRGNKAEGPVIPLQDSRFTAHSGLRATKNS